MPYGYGGVGGVQIPGGNSDPNRAYWQDGIYGTREQHEQRRKVDEDNRRRTEAARYTSNIYAQGSPSGNAANTAAANIQNRNLNMTVDPTGRVSLSNEAELARMAEERRRANQLADRESMLRLLNAQTTGGSAATVTHPGAGGNEAARSAAFARAKEQAGQIARASLTAIAEQMAGRGLSGSGMQALADAGAIDRAAGANIDVTRDQAISDAERASELNDLIYQGGIQQRGQDLSNRQSYLSLLQNLYRY